MKHELTEGCTCTALFINDIDVNELPIEEIRKGIIEVSSNEEPYDIFICYKETDALGRRTPDSVIAMDLYKKLKSEGYKVFFSRISLRNKVSEQYEPYIYNAINTAKVMIVFGEKGKKSVHMMHL